ncbi:hypothetical protein N9251_00295 [Gammaproteobacteria bacterium]|nr:hypothetical protein [Gammaproteobacteria bacterium]
MKKLKYLLCAAAVVATLFSCSEEKTPVIPVTPPTPTTPEYPESEGTEGKIEVYVKFASKCNDIVFIGTYLDAAGEDVAWSSDDVSRLAHFTAVPKFEGWYKAVITPKVFENLTEDDNGMVAMGKPVQLDNDGNFQWAYQWGTGKEDTGVAFYGDTEDGTVVIELENKVEPKLQFTKDCKVVYLTSESWKSDPCAPPTEKNAAGKATFNLTCPAIADGGAVDVVGAFATDGWSLGTHKMSKTDATHFTLQFDVPAAFTYKYVMSTDGTNWDWAYQDKNADGEDFGNRELDPSMTATDTVIAWGTKAAKED